ncbi:hypothetical protein DOTSEDRAFT_38896 [Dothistroma septosporum NZE10]|uniref:Uncharacterized protein n=1 Tax=Dothistroma septosporum (strain NZE10 / CBS 128990) TaxID=675120 RepID=M2WI04_DOTSN|nr:hypothetical protein DOTSEDRAFT_38896 [Dothistroma septosporum NZE10]
MKFQLLTTLLACFVATTIAIPDLAQIKHPDGKKALNWPPADQSVSRMSNKGVTLCSAKLTAHPSRSFSGAVIDLVPRFRTMGRTSREGNGHYRRLSGVSVVAMGILSVVYSISDEILVVACILAVSRHAVAS